MNTRSAVKLPRRLNSLAVKPKIELKNRFTNGMVNPAPMEISIKGEMALKMRCQSYDLCKENRSLFLPVCP
jgi:hypothetical protein